MNCENLYSKTPAAKERKLKAGAFSYNTGSLRCPECNGTGEVNLDVQFLPDVEYPVPGLQRQPLRR